MVLNLWLLILYLWLMILALCSMILSPLPQGVVLTHGNMAFTLGAFLYNLDPKPDDM